MAFIRKNFQPIGGQARKGDAPQMWGYRTEDAAAAVDTSGYFNEVAPLLAPGDWIARTTVNSSGVPQNAGWHLVMSNTAGVVDVSDTTALTVTDTD